MPIKNPDIIAERINDGTFVHFTIKRKTEDREGEKNMVVNKRKKFSRQRGSFTHGCGSKKKARNSGNRGGFGMAGTGKRADQKKTMIWKDLHYFGKYGFVSRKKMMPSLNLDDVSTLLERKEIKEEKGVLDLGHFGYGKLLGGGSFSGPSKKLTIKVKRASAQALEKVKEAGGEVILTEQNSQHVAVSDDTQ